MKCINCKNEIANGSVFCNFCGTTQTSSPSSEAARGELLSKLSYVMTESAKCNPAYESFNNIQQDIDYLASKTWHNKLWKLPFFLGLPFAIILTILMMPSVQQSATANETEQLLATPYDWKYATLFAAWFLLWFSLIFIGIFRVRRKYRKNQKRIDELTSRQSVYTDLVTQIYNEANISDFYPRLYFYEYAASCIYTYIFNRQADSLKEAMNLYENHLHQVRMEQGMSEQLAALQRAERLLTRIDANSRAAAASASIAAIGSFIR